MHYTATSNTGQQPPCQLLQPECRAAAPQLAHSTQRPLRRASLRYSAACFSLPAGCFHANNANNSRRHHLIRNPDVPAQPISVLCGCTIHPLTSSVSTSCKCTLISRTCPNHAVHAVPALPNNYKHNAHAGSLAASFYVSWVAAFGVPAPFTGRAAASKAGGLLPTGKNAIQLKRVRRSGGQAARAAPLAPSTQARNASTLTSKASPLGSSGSIVAGSQQAAARSWLFCLATTVHCCLLVRCQRQPERLVPHKTADAKCHELAALGNARTHKLLNSYPASNASKRLSQMHAAVRSATACL
jgi:hypothetical protein